MAAESTVVDRALQQDEKRLGEIDLESKKEKYTSSRRYEAGAWLRKMVGVVVGKDLPAHPSEDEFRLGLRSGIILCKVLNKVKPHSVPKIVEAPGDSILIPDGEALSAYQYFENVRNFLVSVKEMGLPTFETSDLEKGGKSSRIVNCVLALKSYKETGGSVSWNVGENQSPCSSIKQFERKIGELFTRSLSKSSLSREMSADTLSSEESASGYTGVGYSGSLSTIVQDLLEDNKEEDIQVVVENILSRVMEEFEHRLALQKVQVEQVLTLQREQQVKLTSNDKEVPESVKPNMDVVPKKTDLVNEASSTVEEETGEKVVSLNSEKDLQNTQLKCQSARQQKFEQHQKDIKEIKNVLNAAKMDMHLLKTLYEEEVSNLGKHLNGITHAASGYKNVLEENRKLYNLVQDLKGNIRVYCRVRPFLPGQADSMNSVDHLDDSSITVTTPSNNEKDGKKSFTFNKVFGPSATQEEVFADTQPLVRSVLDGYNVCIFSYGQTGSGKTYTMTGPIDLRKETMGVNYRALDDLFLISEQRKDLCAYDISVQMIEIYNEQVRDLLVTDGTNQRLEIRNSSPNGKNVPDANIVPVSSPSDVINLMELGHKNRAVGSTAMNDRSSRSHSCLTVHVQGRDLTSSKILRGCMHLVDLAGSERLDKTEALGDRLKEAQHINKSLSALGDVIAALAQKNVHVPYRNSKLTQLLQDSLGGQAKTLMFVHISPEPDAIGETLSTLKFAERVSTVELGAAKSNKQSSELRELKEQNSSLKAALARKEGEPGRSLYSSSPERFRMKSSESSSASHGSLRSYDVLRGRRKSMDGSTSIEVRRSSTDKPRRQSYDILSDSRRSMDSPDSIEVRSNSTDKTRWQSNDVLNDRRQSMDGSESIEGRSNSSETTRRQSLDLHDLQSWPAIGNPLRRSTSDGKDLVRGDWVDKVMVNKGDPKSGAKFQGRWANEKGRSPNPKYTHNPSKQYSAKSTNKVLDYTDGFEVATTNDSLGATFPEPTNSLRYSGIPNGLGTKVKKSLAMQDKIQDTRSSIPAPLGRRVANGTNSTRTVRPASVDGSRKNSTSK